MRSLPQALVAALVLLGSAPPSAADPVLLPPTASVSGVSQEEWSQRWWQWAASFDRDESPVADRTGALCGSRQSGDVWFLAGTYGTKRTVRTCRVPRDKHLFFPLVNYVVSRGPDGLATCESVTASAAQWSDGATALVLDVDGTRFRGLEQHRLRPRGCFDLGARTPEKLRIYPAAANGYYVMLKPLPPGRHTIHFGGALPSILQAVTYTLIVE